MSNDIKGLISVIVPTYNSAEYILETIQTITNQTYDNIEIIVVDDGSTDSTEEIVRAIEDSRISYIKQLNSGGPAGPRNLAIKASKGEFIAIFDSDDLMNPEKLALEFNALKLTPEAAFVFSNFSIIDNTGKILINDFFSTNKVFQMVQKETVDPQGNYIFQPGQLVESLFFHNFIATSSILAHKRIFRDLGPFDESLKNTDDYDMWFRIIPSHSSVCIPKVLHQYRNRDGNISSQGIHKLVDGRTTVLKRHIKKAKKNETVNHVKRKIARYQMGAGYYYFQKYELRQAKHYYINSMRFVPTSIALKYIVSCFFGKNFVRCVRYLKSFKEPTK
jgi:glycosyltransferase involved in cell wall biosynthesis